MDPKTDLTTFFNDMIWKFSARFGIWGKIFMYVLIIGLLLVVLTRVALIFVYPYLHLRSLGYPPKLARKKMWEMGPSGLLKMSLEVESQADEENKKKRAERKLARKKGEKPAN